MKSSFKSFTFLILLLGCSMYSYWLTNKDHQWVVPYINERSPAAVKDSKDYEKILERPLRVFKREAVAASVMIRTHEGQQSFRMGQFPVSTSKEQANLICLEYPFMKLTFVGEGASLGGRKTELTVSSPCKMDPQGQESLNEVPLPFQELLRRPAQNQEFKFSDDIDIKVDNMMGDWPRVWQLKSVEFFRDPSSQEPIDKIVISQKELLEKLGEPVLIK